MRILYWGTPIYAVPTLKALHQAGHQIVGVVTQPDRRRRRGNKLQASPVKACAESLGLKVFTPERIKTDLECQGELAKLNCDISIVVAFGQILPKVMLNQFPLGCWNGHGSLLPRWRGAGPIQWALMEGDTETGVGIMDMEEELDTGPILIEQRIPIGIRQNAFQLAEQLSQLTAQLMVKAIPLIEAAGPGPKEERLARLAVKPQTQTMSYARMLRKKDFEINWGNPALTIHRQVMGLYPGVLTYWRGKRLKILDTEPLTNQLKNQLSDEARSLLGRWRVDEHAPSTVLECISNLGIVVSGNGCPLLIREAQLEGKARSYGQSLIQSLTATPGDLLS
ncbi:methionyl-tRNA formyltransferase [Synechococcus sp. M16CYN]|uniref:methionyl-tRNA formyltransferase n=1 Tax=Synechococcus sp. M16CYN TaxID=3103139 RepID=UPI0030E24232